MQLKAIETSYKGYRFRSRLEARWAVFFDALGVPWEYEKEGFDLDGVWYLPDFWLPQQQLWVEIKPTIPNAEDQEKFGRLGQVVKVAMFVGPIPDPSLLTPYGPPWNADQTWWTGITLTNDNSYAWCECDSCGLVDIQYEARSDRLKCKVCYHCNDWLWKEKAEKFGINGHIPAPCKVHGERASTGCLRSFHGDRGHNGDSPKIKKAFVAARAARFDHGENTSVKKSVADLNRQFGERLKRKIGQMNQQ